MSSVKPKRVAIYGGSFNPITDAHLTMCAAIIHSQAADEVWILPCGSRPDKPSLKTSVADRFLMTHLAVESTFTREFPLRVCDIERNVDAAYQTVDLFFENPDPAKHVKYPTLAEFYTRSSPDEPPIEFIFACGSDLISSANEWDISTWNPTRGDWYKQLGFVIFPRPGYPIPEEWSARENVRVLGAEFETTPSVFCDSNLSSSEIRHRIAAATEKGALKTRMGCVGASAAGSRACLRAVSCFARSHSLKYLAAACGCISLSLSRCVSHSFFSSAIAYVSPLCIQQLSLLGRRHAAIRSDQVHSLLRPSPRRRRRVATRHSSAGRRAAAHAAPEQPGVRGADHTDTVRR